MGFTDVKAVCCRDCACLHPHGECECVGSDDLDAAVCYEFLRRTHQPFSVRDQFARLEKMLEAVRFEFNPSTDNMLYVIRVLSEMGFVLSHQDQWSTTLARLVPFGVQFAEVTVESLEMSQCLGKLRECFTDGYDAIMSAPIRLLTSFWPEPEDSVRAHQFPMFSGSVDWWMVEPTLRITAPPADRPLDHFLVQPAECQAAAKQRRADQERAPHDALGNALVFAETAKCNRQERS